ncbi:hypothetical protein ACM66B_006167 [Microbotryomycetes sp. NB124-2]
MAPPGMKRPPKHNQKGRLVQRSSKKRRFDDDDDAGDPDAAQQTRLELGGHFGALDVIDPQEQKRRKEQLRAELQRQRNNEPKMSAKKKKRLDAYIERKLKKEERVKLIESLSQSQVHDLNLQSSATLGSKQFKTQADRLAFSANLEQGRRQRAQDVLKRIKGKSQHLSDDDDDDDNDNSEAGQDELDEEAEDRELERMLIPASEQSLRPTVTVDGDKAPLFNASGSLGVVQVTKPDSASQVSTSAQEQQQPPPKVGSALAAGATVTVVKRNKKGKGRVGRATVKGKSSQIESEDESDFDSSDSANDESSDDDEGEDGVLAADSDEESWKGIPDDDLVDDGQTHHSESGPEESQSEQDESDNDDDDDEGGSEAEEATSKRMKGSFQAWAESQILAATGMAPAEPTSSTMAIDGEYKPLLPAGSGVKAASLPEGISGPLGSVLSADELPTLPPQRSTHVPISRTEEMQKQRAELPIVKEEDRIMEAIRGHAVIVICGETGSGKTTQIGQFLWEAGWGHPSSDNPGMVAITQPRRVAALSTCQRVREELCLPPKSTQVAHRIRYSSNTAKDTKLVFMTDGVLLRELASDFLLTKYSVVVIDEAHERGVNTDVLIGVLSRVARLREDMWKKGENGAKPLRLIIMSATLRVSDFAENPTLFPKPPPILQVSARQHPVTVHFARRTHADYLEQAYKKVARIHARLPAGGVLVFCTGQNEIVSLCKKLEKKFGVKAVAERKRRQEMARKREEARRSGKDLVDALAGSREVEEDAEDAVRGGKVEVGDDLEAEEVDLGDDKDLAADVDDGVYDEDDEEGLESDEDEEKFGGLDLEEDTEEPMHILPLYSLLPTDKQMRVFQDPPAGTRLVVVATNVAETSITIPNIKYVVDSGRAKERQFDMNSGIQSFEVQWISKASAQQRAGRAGRTGPGHCYRLYSSAVYENYFDQFSKPEILRMPIEGVVLQMKSMNIDAVSNFPFPTPPDRDSLRKAEKTLVNLGALEPTDSPSKIGGKITELGRSMALFPLSPRYSKMIVAGQQHGCLPYVIAVVCALSVGDPFIHEGNLGDEDDNIPDLSSEKTLNAGEIANIRDPELRRKEEMKVARRAYFKIQARHAAIGKGLSDVFKVLSVVGAYEYDGGKASFCEANFVRVKAMEEIHKLRAQISRIVQSTYPGVDAGFLPKLQPPTELQLKIIRQLLTSSFIDQVAIRKDLADKSNNVSFAKVGSTRNVPYRAFGLEEDLFIHPSSTLFHQPPPEFIVFAELHRTHKVWLKTVTVINPAWLPTLGRPMCTFSKPIESPATTLAHSKLKVDKSLGPDVRQTIVVPRFGPGTGIELKPVLMTQKLVNGRWVFA